jgi:hypothetical protein
MKGSKERLKHMRRKVSSDTWSVASSRETVVTEFASTTAVTTDSLRIPRFQDAYQRCKPLIDAMPKDKLLSVNLDVPTIVACALGSMSEIRKLQEAAATLPGMDVAHFKNVEQYALALAYAHSLHQAASTPTLPLQELSARGLELRELLLTDCTALARRGLIDGRRLKELKGHVGYKNVASDLLTLVALLREAGARVQGKTAVDARELDEGEVLADQLLTAVGEREQLPVTKEATFDNRERAYTLFLRSYDQIRRAAHYLRWDEDDADELVPSLYATRKRKGSEVIEEEEPAPAPTPPAPDGGMTPAPTSGAPVGMPGADPFTS